MFKYKNNLFIFLFFINILNCGKKLKEYKLIKFNNENGFSYLKTFYFNPFYFSQDKKTKKFKLKNNNFILYFLKNDNNKICASLLFDKKLYTINCFNFSKENEQKIFIQKLKQKINFDNSFEEKLNNFKEKIYFNNRTYKLKK